jgi:predicted transcriptional regulator
MEFVSNVLKALQSPARQKILVLLMNTKHRSMTELARLANMNQTLTFQNLQLLQNVGVVLKTKDYRGHPVYAIRKRNHGYIAAIFDNAKKVNSKQVTHTLEGFHDG